MPRGGRWKTGASASRAGYMAAYRAGVNKGSEALKGEKVDLGGLGGGKSAAKMPDLAQAAKTQADPGVGSMRLYGKEPGRQTAPNKDGARPEANQFGLPGIRDLVGDDVGATLKSEGMGGAPSALPGFSRKGGI